MNDDFVARLLLAIHGIADDDLRTPEAEGKWSIADVIAHLGDFERLTALRLRMILAQENPTLPTVDGALFVITHRGEPLATLIEELSFARHSNLALVSRLSEAELARTGVHFSARQLTLSQLMERAQKHQEQHLRQIARIKSAHGLTAPEG